MLRHCQSSPLGGPVREPGWSASLTCGRSTWSFFWSLNGMVYTQKKGTAIIATVEQVHWILATSDGFRSPRFQKCFVCQYVPARMKIRASTLDALKKSELTRQATRLLQSLVFVWFEFWFCRRRTSLILLGRHRTKLSPHSPSTANFVRSMWSWLMVLGEIWSVGVDFKYL